MAGSEWSVALLLEDSGEAATEPGYHEHDADGSRQASIHGANSPTPNVDEWVKRRRHWAVSASNPSCTSPAISPIATLTVSGSANRSSALVIGLLV